MRAQKRKMVNHTMHLLNIHYFGHQMWKYRRVWPSGKIENNLYVLNISKKNRDYHDVNVTTSECISDDLWNQRCGHLSINNLHLLRDQNLVNGLDFNQVKNLSFVQVVLVHKESKRKHNFRKDKQLELVNVWKLFIMMFVDGGPMEENRVILPSHT